MFCRYFLTAWITKRPAPVEIVPIDIWKRRIP